MALKFKNEILHTRIVTRHDLDKIGNTLYRSLNPMVTNNIGMNDGIGLANAKESYQDLEQLLELQFDQHLYSLTPVCVHYVTRNFEKYYINPKILHGNGLDIDDISIQSSNKNFMSLHEFLDWLYFLDQQQITNNVSYELALHNLSVIIGNMSLDTHVVFYDLKLKSKKEKLSQLNENLQNYISDSDPDNPVNHHLMKNHKKALETNQTIKEVANSNKPFYLACSEKEIHKNITTRIFNIKKYLIDSEINRAKPIVCPNCHTYTYNCFPYCQNCGAKLNVPEALRN